MGGILGSCTGFSIITTLEFIYWFSARILIDNCTKNKKISPDDATEKEPKEECQQCTDLECKVKTLESELGKQKDANKQQMEANKQQIEETKQQMAETKQEMAATKQEMEQKIAQLEILLKSNARLKNNA